MNRSVIVALAFLLFASKGALAGQSCEPRTPKPEEIRSGLSLAYKVQQHLEAQGAQAAIVGRVGRDLSEYGLRYSHIGVAVRDEASARWIVAHELNHCGRADSDLYDQGLGNFFLDDLYRFEAILVIPSRESQERLVAALANGTGRRLHEPSYSLIAHPYSTKYQNSNQWVLELAAAALAGGEASRPVAHTHLRQDRFQPSVVNLPPLKRLGARMFAANTRFDDHSNEEWSSSRYQIVSAESVIAWLAQRDRVGQSVLTFP